MDVIDAIKGRRTVHDFKPDAVARDHIERMLEAAIWAPNHKLTNPWEFYVISGHAKERLARVRGELKRGKFADPSSEQAGRSYQRAYTEMAIVPYAILVCQRLADNSARCEEDLLAVGCAIQNMMLAAYEMGLGTYWGTGPLLNHQETFQLLGVPAGRRGVGILLVGHATEWPKAPERESLTSKVRWIDKA